MHSTASDGTDTPAELVAKAASVGLAAIALTDHDTLDGIDEARQAADDIGIELISGCEISTASEFGSHHILGLWTDQNNPFLKTFLEMARQRRKKRNAAVLKKLHDLGLPLDAASLGNRPLDRIGRPHIAQALVSKGYVPDRRTAFAKYINSGGLAYVPKSSPSPESAIRILASTGATVVWAHPLLKPLAEKQLEKLTRRFSAAGLSGLEVWHSSHTPEQSQLLLAAAEKAGIGASGGSDYHGLAKPSIMPGVGAGNLNIPYEVLENLKKSRRARGLPC